MTPFEILNEVKRRSAEAVIAQSGLAHEGLRRHLRAVLAGDDPGNVRCFRSQCRRRTPVCHRRRDHGDAGRIAPARRPRGALDGLPADHDYRFPSTRRPFLHQAEAWRVLAEPEPQSALITSGTGSGKTECFLFPILSNLVGQAQGRREPLEGCKRSCSTPKRVDREPARAAVRLDAAVRGKVRYCLYNGDLPGAAKESERRRTPEEVIDRERLRANRPAARHKHHHARIHAGPRRGPAAYRGLAGQAEMDRPRRGPIHWSGRRRPRSRCSCVASCSPFP